MLTNSVMHKAQTIFLVILSVFLLGFEKKGIPSEQGMYSVDVQFSGAAAIVGKNKLNVLLNDAGSRAPVEKKVAIEVIPWMPAHEHGSHDRATVQYQGKGRYLVEGLSFTMPGDWDVYLKIMDGGKEDSVVFNVHVSR